MGASAVFFQRGITDGGCLGVHHRFTPAARNAPDRAHCAGYFKGASPNTQFQTRRGDPVPRIVTLTAALALAVSGIGAAAQESSLPDIGSSAGELLNPIQQERYGAMMLAQLRHHEYLLEDPLIDSWLQSLGTRLAANSDRPRQPFTFFMMRQRQINAFATLGGYIGINAGLVLAAEREDEVAAVMSHEIAHV
ncbi:MAG: M48 family metalloprotease, partial [Lysobacter sp.]|nr:M48 family metalloprotease [Lysobacter sp.]